MDRSTSGAIDRPRVRRGPRLLRTTAVRLALRYVLLYALVLGVAFAALLWSTHRYIDAQVENELERELAALAQGYEAGGAQHLIQAVARAQTGGGSAAGVYLLVAADGTRLAGNLLDWPADAGFALDARVHSAWIAEEHIPPQLYDDDAYWPVIATQFADGSRLLLARNVRQDPQLQELTEYLMHVTGGAMVLVLIMGVMLGHAVYKRVDTIRRTADDIMGGDLSRRIPVSGRNDEFDALAERLNQMLDRIQQLIRGMREVTDNVAHDLRNPLSRMRNRLEVTLLEPRGEQEYREAIAQTVEDAQGLIRTFNAMLEVAQLEAGNHRGEWARVDLAALATDLHELYKPIAAEQGQRLELVSEGRIEVAGSRDLLAQAIGNLLDNAIKYSPPRGTIRLEVGGAGGAPRVTVRDAGPGIPAAERRHVLERFVRLDTSRHTSGNGLGLSLVKAVAKCHQAELVLDDAQPGLIVTLQFPQRA